MVAGLLSPQGQLWVYATLGRHQHRPVPVQRFAPLDSEEALVPVRLGAVEFGLPASVLSDLTPEDPENERVAIWREWAGVGFAAFVPRTDGGPRWTEAGLLTETGMSSGEDEVSLLSEAYAADPGQASLRMGSAQARRLHDLLWMRSWCN